MDIAKFPESYLLYWQQIFSGAVASRPDYTYIFLFDGLKQPFVVEGPNVQWKAVSSDIKKNTHLFWWLQFGLPKLAKKLGVRLLIHLSPAACLRLQMPQAMLLPNGFAFSSPQKKESFWIKRRMPYFFKRCYTLLLPGEANWSLIRKWAPKLKVVKTGQGVSNNYEPLSFAEKELVKEQYAERKEYFLIHTQNLNHTTAILLLKAFSIFKKRQQAGLQLLMIGSLTHQKSLKDSLINYKYRADVQLVGPITEHEVARLTGAAYAVLAFDMEEGLTNILRGIYAETAVIAHENLLKSADFTGIMGSNPQQTELLAEQMKLLYKDENHRRHLIQSSQLVKKQFNWQETAYRFCKAVDDIVNS